VAFLARAAPKGQIGVFVGSWYSQPFIKRVYGEIKKASSINTSIRSCGSSGC